MKTILYQPIFINPQAYFVFPSLYHIEKGDSFIEPANITGQLIINTLTDDPTLTPTILTVKDNNQIDFSIFAGKHIRISQYTNIGAVVLGEWYIPGTPTPPEQPDWFKESIVAWYSPCKQKLTNYDVIEAYVEDFTKWVYRNTRGVAKITNNTIVITNVVETNNIIEDDNEPYSDLTIRVTGATENKYLIVRQGIGKPETHIKKDGVYTFKDNNLYFGFGVSVIGECNITITQLPTSILKDFSGNKHDAYLYGFKGKLNSGVGVYKIDFSKSQNANAFDNFERFNNKFIAKGNYNGNWNTFGEYDINGIVKNKVTIKITGLNNVKDKLALEYGYFTTDSKYIKTITLIDKDGVYTYDLNDIVIPEGSNIAHTIYNRMYFGESIINDINLIVEEIPDYPNQLCYDGKSYRVLTDKEREWVKENLIEPNTVSATKACSALFEPENLEITDEFPNGVIRDSLGGEYYLLPHSSGYTIENGLMKSTDDTFLISIENANENDVKAMIIDMYYDSTVPGSYLNGEYTEGSVKLTNRRIMGINNPTTTSIFQDLMQVLETGFTIGKIALYNKELNKDEFDSEAFHKGFAVRHSTFEKDATTHLFRDGHKELTPGEYLLPFETLYLRVDVPEGYTMQDYVFDGVEQSWKPNTPKAYTCPEYDFHIIAMGEQVKVIKNWSPLTSISTFGFRATDNQIEFAGSTDGGTMSYILDDTDVTKFTIEYTNTAGEGNVYLMIGDKQYDVISGQLQTYSVSGSVKLEFLNMEEINNFAGTIKFTNVN